MERGAESHKRLSAPLFLYTRPIRTKFSHGDGSEICRKGRILKRFYNFLIKKHYLFLKGYDNL